MKNSINTQKYVEGEIISFAEAVNLYKHAPTSELIWAANEIRFQKHPEKKVSWIIDRNINITNVCISNCLFCNFHKPPSHQDSFITTLPEYYKKIKELFELGGDQLLLQGGCHPKLGLNFYIDLFKNLKNLFPKLKLHALGPPEIVHIAKLENISYKECIKKLVEAGLDSLPGAGAEILSNSVRSLISKNKCTAEEWLDVMHAAHELNLTTTATMMYGHIESIEERIEHLFKIRETQTYKPQNAKGFIAFIPWPFQSKDTALIKKFKVSKTFTPEEYIRLIAISRIVLHNIENIQASWLTVGVPVAQICLHAGANDLGSIMIEENVVSKAGASFHLNAEQMQEAIKEAGFVPVRRNQQYEHI